MKFEEYKSGVYRQQYQYKSFLPGKINHEWTWDDPRINVLLEKATKDLGKLNAFTLIVPDVGLYIRMHVIKEVNTLSRTGYFFLNRTLRFLQIVKVRHRVSYFTFMALK